MTGIFVLSVTACTALGSLPTDGSMVSTDTPEPVGLDDPVQTGTSQTDDPESPLQTSTGPSPETVYRSTFKDFGAAPELENEVWLNTDFPLHLADLRGKVVLLDMWTFG